MRHVAGGDDGGGERPPERVEDGCGLSGTGAQPPESLEDLAGPRDLEKTGGPAALA